VAALASLGVDRPHAVVDGNSQSWLFRHGSAVIVVTLVRGEATIAIDAPVVDIRPETEVPLLRAALSAGALLGIARPARRGDKLVLTVTQSFSSMPPPRFCLAIEEIARAADALDNTFAAEFGVRLLGPQMRKGHLFDPTVAGTPKRLLTVTAATRPVAIARPPAPSGPKAAAGSSGAVISAQNVSAFLEVVREQQTVARGFVFAPVTDTVEAAFHYAGACRAMLESGASFEGAQVLLRAAVAARARATTAVSVRALYDRLLADRGTTTAAAPFQLPRIPANQIKGAILAHVALAADVSVTAVRRALLLGALAEVLIAADLAPVQTEKLRAVYTAHLGFDAKTVDSLSQLLHGLAR
jgi:hypothetical protein